VEVSPEELYERDLPRPRLPATRDQELIDKIADQVAKHRALIEAGAFPVHSCALPGGYGLQQLLGVDCSKGAWAKRPIPPRRRRRSPRRSSTSCTESLEWWAT
jgi:hypothetical protein